MKKSRNYFILAIVLTFFLTGCFFLGNSLDVTVEIPFLKDTPISVVLVANRRDGQRVATKMKSKNNSFTGRLKRLEPGEWSLSLDYEYQDVVIGSETLVGNLIVGKENKSLKFTLKPQLKEDSNLIGSIDVPQLNEVGTQISLKESIPGPINSIEWDLVYKPQGSLPQFNKSDKEAQLTCDKEGIYIVEAFAKTDSAYAFQYIFVSSVNSYEYLSYSVQKAEYNNGKIFLLNKDRDLISINQSDSTKIASGQPIDSFVIDEAGNRAALVCNKTLLLWDLTTNIQIKQVDIDISVEEVLLLHDNLVICSRKGTYNRDEYYYIDLKDNKYYYLHSFDKQCAVIPRSDIIASVSKSLPPVKLYIWDNIKGDLQTKGSGYFSNNNFTNSYIWGLAQGCFLTSSGHVLWVDSVIYDLRTSNKKIVYDDEQIVCLTRDNGQLIYAKESASSSQLIIATEENLQTESAIDLPIIKNQDGKWQGVHPLACGYLNNKLVALVSFLESDEVALVYYTR